MWPSRGPRAVPQPRGHLAGTQQPRKRGLRAGVRQSQRGEDVPDHSIRGASRTRHWPASGCGHPSS